MSKVKPSQKIEDEVLAAFSIWWRTKNYPPALTDLELPNSTATILKVLEAAAERGEITKMGKKFYPNEVAQAMKKAASK